MSTQNQAECSSCHRTNPECGFPQGKLTCHDCNTKRKKKRSADSLRKALAKDEKHRGKKKCAHGTWCDQDDFEPGQVTCERHREYDRNRAAKRRVSEQERALALPTELSHVSPGGGSISSSNFSVSEHLSAELPLSMNATLSAETSSSFDTTGLTECGCCEFGPNSITIQEALPDLPDIAEIDIDIIDGQLIVHEDLPHADGSADNPVVDVGMNLEDQFGQMQLSENITKGASSASEICNYCGKVGPGMLRCSRCQSVSYCGRKCQKQSWKLHKKICVPAAASVSQTVSTTPDAIQQQRKDAGNVTAISQGRTVQRGKQTADDECPVCLDRYTSHGCFSQDEDASGRTKMVLPCKHDVCHRCLSRWRLHNGSTCPLCRAQIPPEPEALYKSGINLWHQRADAAKKEEARKMIVAAINEAPLNDYWPFLISLGGGTVHGKHHSPSACCDHALQLTKGGFSMTKEMHFAAWFHLGLAGGGIVCPKAIFAWSWPWGGKHWQSGRTVEQASRSPPNAFESRECIQHKRSYSSAECFIQALSLSSSRGWDAEAWFCLALEGGGLVGAHEYSRAACLIRSIENYRSIKNYSREYNLCGRCGRGVGDKIIMDRAYKHINMAQHVHVFYARAWLHLAECGGGVVAGKRLTPSECKQFSGQAWYDLAHCTIAGCRCRCTLAGEELSVAQCLVEAIDTGPGVELMAQAWCNLGGRVTQLPISEQKYLDSECYVKSIELHPSVDTAANSWTNLACCGGGVDRVVHGQSYSAKECCIQALELCPKQAVARYIAWYVLGRLGGGTVVGRDFTAVQCELQGRRLDPKFAKQTQV